MTDVAILLLVAALAFALRRAIRIPLIPLLLVAGMALRYSNLALDREVARNVLDIGLAVLVFGAGMELNPKRFGAQARLVVVVGLAQFAFIGLGGVAGARLFGLDWLPALYTGLAISTSSTLIIIRLLKGRQQMFEPFGRLVTGVLLLQDLLIILLLVLLTRLPDGSAAVLGGLGGLGVLLLLSGIGLRWVMPYLVLRLKLDQDTLGLTILTVLFVYMGLAHLLRLPIVAGAFLAGVSLSGFPVNSIARGLVGSITAFFMAIFFVVLGGLIHWPAPAEWGLVAVLTVFILAGTPLLVTAVALRLRWTARAAIESGLLLAMTSEFSLVVALQGLILGQIPPGVFNVVAMVTVLTMTITPLVATDRVTWKLMRMLPGTAPRTLAETDSLRDHVVMLGYGKGSSVVLKALRKAGHHVVVVNDDPVIVKGLLAEGVRAMHGDGSDPLVLDAVHVDRASLIVCSMRRTADADKVLLKTGRGGPLLIVRVFEPAQAERIAAGGGIPVLSSEAAADAFMKWQQHFFDPAQKG